MHPVKQLVQLQQLDAERDAKHRRLKQVVALLTEPEELRVAAATLVTAQAEAKRIRTQRQDLELESKTLDQKIVSVEERLYGGKVKNPKELADLQNDLASLRRRHATLDDHLIEVMVNQEEAEQAEQEAERGMAALRAQWETNQRTLTLERSQLEEVVNQLTDRRKKMTATLAPNLLEPYQRLRHQYNGLAVSNVEDNVCSACGVELSERLLARGRMSDELSFCSNCDRILVIE